MSYFSMAQSVQSASFWVSLNLLFLLLLSSSCLEPCFASDTCSKIRNLYVCCLCSNFICDEIIFVHFQPFRPFLRHIYIAVDDKRLWRSCFAHVSTFICSVLFVCIYRVLPPVVCLFGKNIQFGSFVVVVVVSKQTVFHLLWSSPAVVYVYAG